MRSPTRERRPLHRAGAPKSLTTTYNTQSTGRLRHLEDPLVDDLTKEDLRREAFYRLESVGAVIEAVIRGEWDLDPDVLIGLARVLGAAAHYARLGNEDR